MAIGINSSYREDLSDDFIYFPEECKQKKGSNMSKSSLMERMLKSSTIKLTSVMQDTKFFDGKDVVRTSVPAMNIALSGSVTGGFKGGVGLIAGPSRHFKSSIMLILAAAFQKQNPDGIILFYDSEFGSPPEYFKSFDIDISRVIHTPITSIEDLKSDVMNQVLALDAKDKVMIIVDSLGNLASIKEIDDSLEGKNVADFTRSKQAKSLFRLITPNLSIKDIPFVAIAHTYDTMEMHSKRVVSGGCLLAGTQIRLADGSLKAVEDFVVGDVVSTLCGDREVTATWNPDTLENGEPECYEVKFSDGSSVICSDKHMFLVDGVWVRADELLGGEEVQTL